MRFFSTLLGEIPSANLYNFVDNAPTEEIDPEGLVPKWAKDFMKKKRPDVICKIRDLIKKLSEDTLTPKELDDLTDQVLDKMSIEDALTLKDVNPNSIPLKLNQAQMQAILDTLAKLGPNTLGQKITDLYQHSLQTGAILGPPNSTATSVFAKIVGMHSSK